MAKKKPKPTKKNPHAHANRYGQLAESFLRRLVRDLPGLRQESVGVRMALCEMIFETPTKYRAHSHHEGYARFSYVELEQKFGRDQFNAINDRLGLFEVAQKDGRPDWSMVEERTKAYALTEKVTALREQFLRGCFRRSTRLLTDDGRYLERLPASALAAKNKDGQTRRGFKNLPIKAAVPVNLVQLKKLIEGVQARLYARDAGFTQGDLFSKVPAIGFLRDLQQEAQMVVTQARNENWPGQVLHRYFEIQSGRIYADGAANLTNCRKVVREAAMAGLYDIDIENCHYNILAQMAAQHGYRCVEIQSYLDNKKLIRQRLAEEFGISENQAKEALIALIYGARFSLRTKDALPKIFNKSPELAARVYEYPQFLALRDDIAKARKVVLEAQPISRRTIRNCRGLTINLDDSDPRQQLAHLLQGVEAAALEAAYRLYPEDIVLLQHDGFTATRPLDTARIGAAMLEATGYRLPVEQKVIQVNLERPFDDHPDDLQHQIEIGRKANAGAGLPVVDAS